ncbi:hypothetical protein GCM10009603_17690 [Nocardiopsis exhalans]
MKGDPGFRRAGIQGKAPGKKTVPGGRDTTTGHRVPDRGGAVGQKPYWARVLPGPYFILLPADFRCWAPSTTRAAIPASATLP